jgi:hypothetical protein
LELPGWIYPWLAIIGNFLNSIEVGVGLFTACAQNFLSALLTFHITLDGCKSISKIRNGPADSGLSDNRSLDTRQACLFGTHERDQVKA